MATFNPGDKVRYNLKPYNRTGKDEWETGTIREVDPNGMIHIDTPKGVMTYHPEKAHHIEKLSAMSRNTIVRDRATGRVGRVVGMARTGGVVVKFGMPMPSAERRALKVGDVVYHDLYGDCEITAASPSGVVIRLKYDGASYPLGWYDSDWDHMRKK